ncbi:hypothetical protein B0H17DRAFT_1155315 [Mycena rosella]|uniref:Uncharacterized protein n=1 Tax=Mycena rosella TaxID=1033263 RepID=A0AAD7AWG1_MYCRO|nr:hypothetical protein B0H17DRAFT_1155315 [Mycena rosella]
MHAHTGRWAKTYREIALPPNSVDMGAQARSKINPRLSPSAAAHQKWRSRRDCYRISWAGGKMDGAAVNEKMSQTRSRMLLREEMGAKGFPDQRVHYAFNNWALELEIWDDGGDIGEISLGYRPTAKRTLFYAASTQDLALF